MVRRRAAVLAVVLVLRPAVAPNEGCHPALFNSFVPGLDVHPPIKPLKDWQDCCDECTDRAGLEAGCQAICFSTNTNTCWLKKHGGGTVQYAPGVTCGHPIPPTPPPDASNCKKEGGACAPADLCCAGDNEVDTQLTCSLESKALQGICVRSDSIPNLFQRFSWGTMVCAVLLALGLVYLAVGSLVTRARGNGWLPHRTAWQGLAGLIVDGLSFSAGGRRHSVLLQEERMRLNAQAGGDSNAPLLPANAAAKLPHIFHQ